MINSIQHIQQEENGIEKKLSELNPEIHIKSEKRKHEDDDVDTDEDRVEEEDFSNPARKISKSKYEAAVDGDSIPPHGNDLIFFGIYFIKLHPLEWQIHYAALVAFGNEFGHCNVTQKYIYECDLPGLGEGGSVYHYRGKLGVWLSKQRSNKRSSIPGGKSMSPEREVLLQNLVDEGSVLLNLPSQI
jgi:hypothetical protein